MSKLIETKVDAVKTAETRIEVIEAVVLREYHDLEIGRHVKAGEVITVSSEERLAKLVSMGLVEAK